MASKKNKIHNSPFFQASVLALLVNVESASRVQDEITDELFVRLGAANNVLFRHGLVSEYSREIKRVRKERKAMI